MAQDQPRFEHPQSQSSQPTDYLPNPDQSGLQQQVDDLSRKVSEMIRSHRHNGLDATTINFNTDLQGLFETVSVAPTTVPKSPYDQVKIYVNSTTYRLYWYDSVGHVWHYVTATA